MKKIYLGLLSFACLSFMDIAVAEDAPVANSHPSTAHFNPEQVSDIKKIVAEYIVTNPTVVMASFQAGMAEQQKEELAKLEKAVIAHKDKLVNNDANPTAGNLQGTESLVVFMDPYCGYCKKFHGELAAILSGNKDVKITFIDIPIMGPGSTVAVKAMLAAKAQGKYDQMQKAIFAADKHLTKKQILKIAEGLGIDKKQFETALKSEELQAQIDQNAELAKTLGINGTPTLVVNATKVMPGFMNAEEVNKLLKVATATAEKPAGETKPADKKAS